MKKLLLFLAAAAMTTGCTMKKEYLHSTIYIYENQCSEQITIKSYSPGLMNGEIVPGVDSIFSISSDNQKAVKFWSDEGFSKPLNWRKSRAPIRDSTIVVKGDKIVIYREWLNDPLYSVDAYELVKSEEYERTYRFIFTDDFFENGEPIE